MFISELSITDFKNIKQADFKFNKINLISGDTGEGKTAVIEALTFLLTNTLQDRIEEYVRWGRKKFVIKKAFTYKAKKYAYTITAGGITDRELIIGENSSNVFYKSDAVKELATIIDPNLTLYSNISMQHKSTELLFEKPTPRLQKIKPIFKVDKISEKVELIKTDIKENNRLLELSEIEINTLRGMNFEFMDEPILPDWDISELNNTIKKLEQDRETAQKEKELYEVYKSEHKRYEDSLEIKKELNGKLLQYNSQLEKKKKSIIVVPDRKTIEYEEIKEKRNQIKNEIYKLSVDVETYKKIENEKGELQDKIKEREKLLNDNKLKRLPRISFTEEDIHKNEKELQEICVEYKVLNDKLLAIQNGKCPTCGAEYVAVDIHKLKEEIFDVQALKDEYSNSLQKDKDLLKEKDLIEKENKVIKARVDIWERDIETFNNKLKEYEKVLIPNIDKLRELKEISLSLDQQFVILDDLQKACDEGIKFNISIEKEIQGLSIDIITFNSKLVEYDKIVCPNKVELTTIFNAPLYDEINEKIFKYNQIKFEIKKVQEYNDKIQQQRKKVAKDIGDKEKFCLDLKEKNSILKETASILDKDFSSYLIDIGSAYIKSKMNTFFQKGYGKYQIDLKQDGKGIEFFYSENGGDWHSISMLSGFEQQIFATSFRIALCHLQDLNFFIADEIDSDASANASLKLYQAILNENFEQLFVISHCEGTKEFFSNIADCKIFEIKNGELEN